MANERDELRILIPTRPKDDLGDVTRALAAFLPPERIHARCLYVHRPVEADYFISENFDRGAEIAQLEFDAETATRMELELEMRRLSAAGCRVSAEVVRGTPAEQVIHESGFWKADWVAVRTRSLAAHDHRIGGMASALLYHGTCPVFTHHAVPEGYRARRILIPTDFSASSRRGTGWGLALAGIAGAEAIFLHAMAEWNGRHGIDQEELYRMATAELGRWKARADSVFPKAVKAAQVITASSPADGILAFAREKECDLIVLSATGASVMRSILVGANTRHVVRASHCPVLVVPEANRVRVDDFLSRAAAATSGDWATAMSKTTGERGVPFVANRL